MDHLTRGTSGPAVSPEADAPDASDAPPGLLPEDAPRLSPSERLERLSSALQDDIIPRLVRAHRGPIDPSRRAAHGHPAGLPSPLDLARRSLAVDESALFDEAQAWLSAGVGYAELQEDLLAPAARCLGELWAGDRCSFTEVTLATGRLHRLVRRMAPFDPGRSALAGPGAGCRVLLMPAPEEQHTFGLALVGDAFERAGWDVAYGGMLGPDAVALTLAGGRSANWPTAPSTPEGRTLRRMRREHFDCVGLSLGSTRHLDGLRRYITDLRAASRNRDLRVLVGGALFTLHPQAVAVVGADACAADARSAPALALQAGPRTRAVAGHDPAHAEVPGVSLPRSAVAAPMQGRAG